MAKLPKYRPLGVQITSLPTVDYAGTARAQARVAATISDQLDRMSSAAFREAEVQARIEGAEYGAANAPSAKQLLDAQTEERREALTPGGTGTVYDRAARDAAMRTISLNLETAARNEISTARIKAEKDFTPISELQSEIDGIINGYSGALYDISPAAAPQFRASLSSVGNSAAVAHSTIMSNAAKKQAEVDVTIGLENVVAGIGERIFTAAPKGADEIAFLVTSERNRIEQLSDIIDDDAKLAQYLGDFQQKVDSAMIGIVSDWALTDPIANRQQWLDKKITDPAVANVVSLMTADQRRSAFVAIGEAEAGFYTRQSQQETVKERDRKAEVERLSSEFNKVLISGNHMDADRVFALLNPLDASVAKSYRDAFYTDSTAVDDEETVFSLQLLSSRGELTESVILGAIVNRKISKTSSGTFFNALQSQNNTEHQQAMKLVRGAFGIPDAGLFTIDAAGKRTEALRFVAQFQSELIRAEKIDPNLDRIALADTFIAKGNLQKLLKTERSELETIVNEIAIEDLDISDTSDLSAVATASTSLQQTNQSYADDHLKLMDAIARIKEINNALGDM